MLRTILISLLMINVMLLVKAFSGEAEGGNSSPMQVEKDNGKHDANSSKSEKVSSKQFEKDGGRLEAKLPALCNAGEATILTVTLSNIGKDPLYYGHINPYLDFALEMTTAKGDAVPLTAYGKTKIRGSGQFGVVKKYSQKTLSAGESYSIEYNLARLFDITVAGTYNIRIRRRINENGTEAVLDIQNLKVVVEDVAIKVKQPNG